MVCLLGPAETVGGQDIDSDDEPQEVPVADEEKDDGVPPDTSQKALPSRNQQLQPQGTS